MTTLTYKVGKTTLYLDDSIPEHQRKEIIEMMKLKSKGEAHYRREMRKKAIRGLTPEEIAELDATGIFDISLDKDCRK